MEWKAMSLAAVCAAVLAFACWPTRAAEVDASAPAGKAATQRQREGASLVDVLGRFKVSGDRANFYPLDSQVGYAGLENLNLERVMLMITDNTDELTWQVSGTITEFRGANYLLISRVVLKTPADAADLTSRPGTPSRAVQKQTSAGGKRDQPPRRVNGQR